MHIKSISARKDELVNIDQEQKLFSEIVRDQRSGHYFANYLTVHIEINYLRFAICTNRGITVICFLDIVFVIMR